MSLYADYIKEREGKHILETDKGFATYFLYDNGECYIQDIYIAPDFRKTGLSTKMVDEIVEIAKENKCHTLLGSICIDDKNATVNMKIWLNYGFCINKIVGPLIFLKKDIGVE